MSALRIGMDIRALGGQSGRRGVGVYIRGLLRGLAAVMEGDESSRDEIVLFGNHGVACPDLPRAFETVELRRPRRAITLWDQLAWPWQLSRRELSVFHSPFYAIPRIRPGGCRVVQTIHDLTPLKLPGVVSRHNARIFRANFRLARSADRILVPSRATRADVIEHLRIDPGNVVVIPEAADITAGEIDEARARLPGVLEGLGLDPGRGKYLLHSGGHDVVKNLPGLLQAFSSIAGRRPELFLVVVGEHGRDTSAIIGRAAMTGLLERIRLPGFVPRPDLIALYLGAAAMVYPSFTEGFGLPVLEAMTCGTPVVASRAGSLPEIGADACVFVDPADPEQIAAAVESVLDDSGLARRLSEAGRRRASGFDWTETARRTLELYREVAA